jgi:hypothetical protein
VRFSSSDGCERVQIAIHVYAVMNVQIAAHVLRTFATPLLVHMHQKENIALEITAKIASVNRPLDTELYDYSKPNLTPRPANQDS